MKTIEPATFDSKKELENPYPIRTAQQKNAAVIYSRSFFIVLVLLCALPIITISIIWQFLPAVAEGKLEAKVSTVGIPSVDYYKVDYRKRNSFEGGELVITNLGQDDWTHLNITINKGYGGGYQIFDTEPIKAGASRSFRLGAFVSRSGATFQLRYNEVKSVMIYARLPSKKRATFWQKFDTVADGTRK